MGNLGSVQFHLLCNVRIDEVVRLMEHNVIHLISSNIRSNKGILDISRNFANNEVENIPALHIALFIAAHIAILINNTLLKSLGSGHMAITARLNHNQVCSRAI